MHKTTFDLNDIVRLKTGNTYRVWQVAGVYLGGEDEENIVELETLDRNCPFSKILVPEIILQNANLETK